MEILFVGESWRGSCARSLKEALARHAHVDLDEVNEDVYLPKHRAKWLRGIHRILGRYYRLELQRQILHRVSMARPEVVMVYKGTSLDAPFVRRLRTSGLLTVNVYPDNSPHAHGNAHRQAVGEYDLVISTKPFHPADWRERYGYSNECVFVPQGYDPTLHMVEAPPVEQPFDIAIVATWRPEYGNLMKALAARLREHGLNPSVAVGGHGWLQRRAEFPSNWVFGNELTGRAYVEWLRRGKICIAPVTREVVIDGSRQPGDEDTTRTYELAAAHCFFIHRRTEFVKTLYDEHNEVPMFGDAAELAVEVERYLAVPEERARMAASAHRRAVPAYSLDCRATQIVAIVRDRLARAGAGRERQAALG